MRRSRRFLRDNGLTLAFGLAFLLALAGQAVAGHREYNSERETDGAAPLAFGSYLTSADFAVDVSENWQSEYLQFFLYIFATVWLVQRGSPESKPPDRAGPGSDAEQRTGRHAPPDAPGPVRAGGWRGTVFSRSLGLAMGGIFLASWAAQSVSGVIAHNDEQRRIGEPAQDWGQYVTSAEFWARTFQNWQSEFLAIASMALLSVYLRQRGSPESKPVGAPRSATDVGG